MAGSAVMAGASSQPVVHPPSRRRLTPHSRTSPVAAAAVAAVAQSAVPVAAAVAVAAPAVVSAASRGEVIISCSAMSTQGQVCVKMGVNLAKGAGQVAKRARPAAWPGGS